MILEDVQWVVERSRHVRIDDERLARFCESVEPGQLMLPDWRIQVVPEWRDERLVEFFFLFNSVNFCYWGEPKWTVEFRGRQYDGAYGMMAALTRALVDDGLPLLDGAFLVGITPEVFGYILRGNVPIPLEEERLDIWHQVGPVLCSQFSGRWYQVVERAGGSAVQLVNLLVNHFPSFDDAALFDGRSIAFYKRAQLAVGMVFQAYGGQARRSQLPSPSAYFDDFDQLTVYADYKLPQVLRSLGILVYDNDLASLVDNLTHLPAGGRMEVEIRAATVWAGELMLRQLVPRAPTITANHIDFSLWEAGQKEPPGVRPYHRTLTTAY
jgi:hypothetical protein